MNPAEAVTISKRLSYILRHRPDSVGLTLDDAGWTTINALLDALSATGDTLTPEALACLVETNSKRRFEFDETGTRIRASQGHSVGVSLGYQPETPPAVLYHGTPAQNLDSILATGLDKRARHHVHMSADRTTTLEAARRRGKPVLLAIDAIAMHAAGHAFFKSTNDVWLCDSVPPSFLTVITDL